MLRDFVAAIAMALAVLSATFQASAQRVCGEHAVIVTSLAELYGERPFALGIESSGNLVEVLVGFEGSWTILVIQPNGRTCVVASGEAWHTIEGKPDGPAV